MSATRRQARLDRIKNGWSDVAVYAFAQAGIHVSGYVDPFLEGAAVELTIPKWGMILFAAVAAWGLAFLFDAKGFKTEKAREGRRKRWLERTARAAIIGMLCRFLIPRLIDLIL